MVKFVKCWFPGIEGEAEFHPASLPHQMKKGWIPVEEDPVDEGPIDFDDEVDVAEISEE